jgi:ubiquinone/menaquinone biosynthesis C-methylase UbiE
MGMKFANPPDATVPRFLSSLICEIKTRAMNDVPQVEPADRGGASQQASAGGKIHAPVRRSYDALAASYDTRWRHYIDATSALAIEPIAPGARDRVLNIACGTGELERRLRAQRPHVRLVGADLSLNMLRRAASKELRADWLTAVASHLPLASCAFDYVLCVNAFHYFRLPAESLAEMRRVLRPGGTMVLVDWCDDYWICKLCSAWLRLTDRAYYRTYTLANCQTLLEQAGFRVIAAKRHRINWLWGLMRIVCRA